MKTLPILLISTALLSASPNTSVILMIGDGMGPAYTSSYRYYKEVNTSRGIQKTIFDTLFMGRNSTYSKNSVITDSAAAATALATGYKTDNGYVGLRDTTDLEPQTLLEYAKEKGYVTAMAVTSTLTHATPAAFLSKGHHRKDETGIAKEYFKKNAKGKLKFDFLIGGGEKYFIEGYADFNVTAKENNVTLYRNGYDLNKVTSYPFIAFTANDYPSFAIDESEENRYRVAKMTQKSLDLMKNKPFFMMIEASQIDWCGHINDVACMMAEMEDFSRAITLAKAYVDTNKDTLLLVTADHSTAGLALGDMIDKKDKNISDEVKSRSYIWYKDIIENVSASSIVIAKDLSTSKEINATFKKYTDITLNTKEYKVLSATIASNKEKKLWYAVNDIINNRSNTGWTSHGHTAVDVETFAYGKGSEKFRGFMDNTDIAKKIFEVLGRKSKK